MFNEEYKFENDLHKSISRLYTLLIYNNDLTEKQEKEVRKSVRYIIRWCIKHGANIPPCDSKTKKLLENQWGGK
jgi:hypothetical protein